MTSKEALFNLVRIHYGYENKNDFDECVKVLEKDLEVVEKMIQSYNDWKTISITDLDLILGIREMFRNDK